MDTNKENRARSVLFTVAGLIVFFLLLYFLFRWQPDLGETFHPENILAKTEILLPKIIALVLLFFIFKLLYIFVIEIFFSKFRKVFVNRIRFNSLKKLIHFFWWVLYIIIVLFVIVSDAGALVASLGLIGLGLTFALQKPIMNFVGWLTIILKDVYNEGDRIMIGTIRGDVKEIQLMNTVLYGLLETSDTRSHKIITVPNDLVLTTDVENYTKDSNYIMDELIISITYESDYHKAKSILEEIVIKHLKKNLKSYISWKKKEKIRVDDFLKGLIGKNKSQYKIEILEKEQSDIDKELSDLEHLEETFAPKIRIEMADSAILLIAQFLTPYDQIKKNRTEINLAFLDAISGGKEIEVAYPHMELVYNKDK